jgi:hypothetical protein
MFYNPTRRRQTLDWSSPIDFEVADHDRLKTSAESTQNKTTTIVV